MSDSEPLFVMRLRLVRPEELARPTLIPDHAKTDLTLSRLQKFKGIPSASYRWRVRQGSENQTFRRYTVADADGLLTIPGGDDRRYT